MRKSGRPITVDATEFRWHFDGRLVVRIPGRGGIVLSVDWGWVDPWLEISNSKRKKFPQPETVTPRFVRDAILAAAEHGWPPEKAGPPLKLGYDAKRELFYVADE